MRQKSGLPPSFYGIFGILVCLTLLAFVPPLLKKTSFRWEGAWSDKDSGKVALFPVDMKFPLIPYPGNKRAGTVTLGELARASKAGLIVNFWATWCPPCVEELPSLETLNRQLGAEADLPQLVTISVDDSPSDVVSFFKTLEYPVSLPVLFDKDATFSRSIGTTRFPETYWVSPEGRVLYKWVGPQNWLSGEVLRKLRHAAS